MAPTDRGVQACRPHTYIHTHTNSRRIIYTYICEVFSESYILHDETRMHTHSVVPKITWTLQLHIKNCYYMKYKISNHVTIIYSIDPQNAQLLKSAPLRFLLHVPYLKINPTGLLVLVIWIVFSQTTFVHFWSVQILFWSLCISCCLVFVSLFAFAR